MASQQGGCPYSVHRPRRAARRRRRHTRPPTGRPPCPKASQQVWMSLFAPPESARPRSSRWSPRSSPRFSRRRRPPPHSTPPYALAESKRRPVHDDQQRPAGTRVAHDQGHRDITCRTPIACDQYHYLALELSYGALAHATRSRPSRSTSAVRCTVAEPNDCTAVRTPRPSSSKYRTVVGDTGEVETDIIAGSADTVPAVPHAAVVDIRGHRPVVRHAPRRHNKGGCPYSPPSRRVDARFSRPSGS